MSGSNNLTVFWENLPADRQPVLAQLRQVVVDHLPDGFEEVISGSMLHYVVPLRLYPAGYHCQPTQPLPFISLASQKQHVAVYHMGVYADPDLLSWFTEEYARVTGRKPDMGKSCIRFKKPETIPFALIGELAGKWTPADWIRVYEANRP